MRYFNMLDELLSSDTIIFLLIGGVIGFAVAPVISKIRTKGSVQ